ncbi:MAG: sulfatase-like hydrolase/transferase [Actinomycetota bacterium]
MRRPTWKSFPIATLLLLTFPSVPAHAATPQIDHLSPWRGPVGARVSVLGAGLAGTTRVTFGSVEAPFRTVSDSKIVTHVPDSASSDRVTVETGEGSALSPQAFVVQPNIVLILTDDQRAEQITQMPVLESTIAGNGVTFNKGYVVDPLCCPSRASILTGRYSHSTDIYANGPPHGGFQTFTDEGEDTSTVATWLQGAGYRTALVGKYLNGYDGDAATYVPPGWNVWRAFAGATPSSDEGLYYDYSMSINGHPQFRGNQPSDYSTDVLTQDATSFIAGTPASRPLFLYFAPTAPHIPAKPEADYLNACPQVQPNRPPSYNEQDVSDKPAYIRSLPPWSPQMIAQQDGFYVRQCRTLQSVDDGIGAMEDALRASGRLSSTFFVFLTDNGNLNGEHRWAKKLVPYEESIHVPFVIRYDPLTSGTARTDDQHFVLNVDLAPTFADLAGISAPGAEGTSLLPLIDGEEQPTWRSDFLVEHWNLHSKVPTYCGVRNDTALYVEYGTGERELYDLAADPFELQNVDGDPAYASLEASMHDRLVELCSPPPPGFAP